MNGSPSSAFANMPVVVKNLLIINGLFYLATLAFPHLTQLFGAYYYDSPNFKIWQVVTHMFMHSRENIMHIFFNMFALWMFGSAIERVWGSKKFLNYYLITGLGAFFLHYAVVAYQAHELIAQLGPDAVEHIKTEGIKMWNEGYNYSSPPAPKGLAELNAIYNIPVVGASGAVFGLLLAFGMMFPNVQLMMLFFPVPIKAKYFVMLYGALELFSGLSNRPGDNVAHFAHLGGMLFGYILIKYWQSNGNNYRQY